MNVTKFNQNGEMTIQFSEKLYSLEDFKETLGDLDLETINIMKENIVMVKYKCDIFNQMNKRELEIEKGSLVIPSLYDWKITSLTEYEMGLKLNFTNPLLVSSFEKKDLIDIKVRMAELFKAKSDGLLINRDYRINNIVVP